MKGDHDDRDDPDALEEIKDRMEQELESLEDNAAQLRENMDDFDRRLKETRTNDEGGTE